MALSALKMALPLLVMLLTVYITSEAAGIKKSTAAEFLSKGREKRSSECYEAGCSNEESESEELLESQSVNEETQHSKTDGGPKPGQQQKPEGDTDEGSGM
ncbi:hypothetical protein AOXY_G18967 [Acipenser oxyrinchus oxyrinchus]|uniref:Uncharacterized protein n=1 Tax=Acipenser oxyrinchus oxyrinchus TaxID=40147 RepID=A0AAD8FZ21_ACIOX|nr:hypothetical protein AOXY_G18967 [Acipenser oxyrinchus oxyrinchus]